MTFRFSYTVPFFLTVLFFALPLHATDLFFAPKRVNLSDKEPVAEIRVTNQSNIAKSYAVSTEDIIMMEEGVTSSVAEFEYSARRMLRFVPRQFELKPGGKQIVRIMARVPADKEDGQYHCHLKFLENVSRREELNPMDNEQEQAKALAQVSFSTAIPISIEKGQINTVVDMSDVRIEKDKNGRPVLSMILNRSGNGQGNILLDLEYQAPDGTTTKIGSRRSIYVYREIDRRIHSTPLELPGSISLQKGGRIKVALFNKDKSEDTPVKELTLPVQ